MIYWHLLSLDAPVVAMLWTWFIAKSSRIDLPVTAVVAMGVAVWALYVCDRLLDSRREGSLEARHLFHRRHQRPFLTGLAVSAVALGWLIPRLPAHSLALYSILGALLAGYFLLIHLQQDLAPRLPKEIAVGVFFSAATFIPTVARNPGLRPQLLPAAILFGLVCSLNCLFIYAWEHPSPYSDAHFSTQFILRVLLQISVLIIMCSKILCLFSEVKEIPAAVAIAGLLLLLLHANRRRLSPTALRAAADLCLLTPIFFVFAIRA